MRKSNLTNIMNVPLTPVQDDAQFQNKLSFDQRRKFKDSFNQFIRQRSLTNHKKSEQVIKKKSPKKTMNILFDKNFIDKLDDPFSVSVLDQAREEQPRRGR